MNEIQKSDIRLLEAFSCALSSKTVNWSEMPEKTIWKSIYRSAEEHKIFPMVMESISGSRFFVSGPNLEMNYRFYLKRAETETYTQAKLTGDFLLLYDFLLNKGLKPLVMKGIVCRSLYPQPEQRPSCDEDLLIDQEDFYAYHQAMLEYGLEPVNPDQDFDKAFEVAYRSEESSLFIEIHKFLFPPESKVFSKWNTFFTYRKEAFPINIYGSKLYTMEPTGHLIYLILHALKHFLYGGFGIRQIADIVLFSKTHTDQINWEYVESTINEVRAKDFVRAIFKIASLYLWESLPEDNLFPGWDFGQIDELPLLCDVLASGVYGDSSRSRIHSSNITLYAVNQQASDQKTVTNAVLHAVFPSRKNMEKKYPYLRKASFLLPVAWLQRITGYIIEIKSQKHKTKNNNIAESARLGQERIQLMKQYNIVK